MAEDKPANPGNTPQPPGTAPPARAISPDELRKALKAFKKRLKLVRLDDESRLGHAATTKGGSSGIRAIQVPNQFPQAVWDQLVREGRLRYVGHGLYELNKAGPGESID
jgi:aryl-alcohol dehydrogenase-like predicted oxidoreductase